MDSLNNKYALGLFSIAVEENKVKEYKNDLKTIKEILIENGDLLRLFSSYFILLEEKENVVDKIFFKYDEYIRNFIKLIIKNRNVKNIINIFDEFNKLCNSNLKIKEGIIYSTINLSSSQIEQVENTFNDLLSSKVELTNVIDENLIGGYKVIIEEKIFDNSIRSKLQQMKISLKQGAEK